MFPSIDPLNTATLLWGRKPYLCSEPRSGNTAEDVMKY